MAHQDSTKLEVGCRSDPSQQEHEDEEGEEKEASACKGELLRDPRADATCGCNRVQQHKDAPQTLQSSVPEAPGALRSRRNMKGGEKDT